MKTHKLLTFFTALLFNMVFGGAIAAATGLPPALVYGSGTVLTTAIGNSLQGVAPMAIQKEIWLGSLVENLFADNSFMSRAFNADEFVTAGSIVHIPNAGAPSSVSKNRKQLPATVKTRNDVDLTFTLNEFTTDPIKISNAETVELSYNKRESLLRNDKSNLFKEIAEDFIYSWSTTVAGNIIRTSGAAVAAHMPGATGTRKAFVKGDLLNAMNIMNANDIPQEGRTAMLDAIQYGQLLASMTDNETADFNKQADVSKGVLGKIYSFDVIMRSRSGRYTAALAPKYWTAANATTDHAAAICWQSDCVCRALGETKMFDSENNPLYYGDIYSFLARAGGRIMRNDGKGVLAIVQDNG